MQVRWILAAAVTSLAAYPFAAMVACSSGTNDTVGSSGSGSGTSSGSGSGTTSGASGGASGSSSGGVVDSGADVVDAGPGETLLFPVPGLDGGLGCWTPDLYGTPQSTNGGYPAPDAADAGPPIDVADASLLPQVGSSPPEYFLSGLTTVSFDPTVNAPTGSMGVAIPFDNWNEQSDVQCVLANPLDLTGQVLFVDLELDSGFISGTSSTPGGFIIVAKTGSTFAYGQSTYANWVSPVGVNHEFTFDLGNPDKGSVSASFDPSQVVEVEIHFDTGGGGADGGGMPLPAPSMFHVTQIGYRSAAQ